MYGPSRSDIVGFAVLLLVVGALVGTGCEQGCAYLRRHVSVDWIP